MKNIFWTWVLVGLIAVVEAFGIATGRFQLSMGRQIGSDILIVLQAGILCMYVYYDNNK